MNKTGSLTDLVMIAGGIFVFAVVMLIGYTVFGSFDAEIQTMDDVPSGAKTASTNLKGHFGGVLDNSALFIFFGLGIVSFMLAAMVRVHPVFLFLYFIMLLVVVVVCGALSNVYQEMAASTEMAVYAADLGVSAALMTYLPIIVGVLGTLLAIVMYKSWKENA